MFKKLFFCVLLVFLSGQVIAGRGYVGLNPVSEVFTVDSSNSCGQNAGRCLLIYFDGGALGCNPASSYIAIRESHPTYKDFKTYALVSLTTSKKFRTYGTRELCADADGIGANGASVYKVAH